MLTTLLWRNHFAFMTKGRGNIIDLAAVLFDRHSFFTCHVIRRDVVGISGERVVGVVGEWGGLATGREGERNIGK